MVGQKILREGERTFEGQKYTKYKNKYQFKKLQGGKISARSPPPPP